MSIGGKHYYFFRIDRFDGYPEYRIAESLDDLHLRFGHLYFKNAQSITNVGEVTRQHILAIQLFLDQQL